MSLRVKIILLFSITTLIPFIVIATFLYTDIKNNVEKSALQNVDALATIQKARTVDLISKYHLQLEQFSSRLQLRQELALYSANGNEKSQTKIMQIITEAKNGSKTIKDILILNNNGVVIASTDSQNIKKNLSQEEFYQKGKDKNDTTVFFKENRIVYLNLVGPLISDGNKIGVIVLQVKTDDLFNLYKEYTGLGKTGSWGVGQKNKNGDALIIVPGRFDKNPDSALKSILSKKNTKAPLTQALMGNEKIVTDSVDYLGRNIISATRYIPEAGWGIGVVQAKSEVYAVSDTLASQLIFISAILAIFIGFLSSIIAQIIIRPITKLSRLATKVASGDLSVVAEVNSQDELGLLTKIFNDMIAKLRKSYETMEDKVKERTSQLSAKVAELEDTKKATLNILEDLDETKERIQKEKAKDDAILASIGEGVVVANAMGKLIYWNNAAEQILAMKLSDTPQEQWDKKYGVFYEDQKTPMPGEKQALAVALQGKDVIGMGEFIRNPGVPNGRNISVTARPIYLVDKTFVGAVAVFRDVTQEKEVDRMKTEFISLASHQLRTPLSAMKWFLEMLLAGDAGTLTSEQREMVGNVDQSNERMIALVNSLLNVSRIESGRIIIDPQPTDLGKLVGDVQIDIKAKLEERKQTLIISVNDNLPKINIDPKLIRQVYMNLLTNAIKYSPVGGEISIFISKKDDQILSQISDDGYGIPAKDKDKVFNKFYRGENIVKMVTDGNGLGLYLVKAIIESSQGKIWFESTEGKGTSFWLSLPLSGSIAKKGEVSLDS